MFSWNANPSASAAVSGQLVQVEWAGLGVHLQVLLEHVTRQNKQFADHDRGEMLQYQACDWVWLSTRDIIGMEQCKKKKIKYIGLFKIHDWINEVTSKLDLQQHICIVPSFHMSHLKPVTGGPLVCNVSHCTTCTPQHWRRTSLLCQIHLKLLSQKWKTGTLDWVGGLWPRGTVLGTVKQCSWPPIVPRVSCHTPQETSPSS